MVTSFQHRIHVTVFVFRIRSYHERNHDKTFVNDSSFPNQVIGGQVEVVSCRCICICTAEPSKSNPPFAGFRRDNGDLSHALKHLRVLEMCQK